MSSEPVDRFVSDGAGADDAVPLERLDLRRPQAEDIAQDFLVVLAERRRGLVQSRCDAIDGEGRLRHDMIADIAAFDPPPEAGGLQVRVG
jgi:hypothetical protein